MIAIRSLTVYASMLDTNLIKVLALPTWLSIDKDSADSPEETYDVPKAVTNLRLSIYALQSLAEMQLRRMVHIGNPHPTLI